MKQLISIEDTETFSESLWDFFGSVPLGNSDYQIRQFVLSHCKKGRNYRQIVLQVKEDSINVKKERIARRKEEAEMMKKEIEIKELETKIGKTDDPYEKQKLECDIVILESEIEELEVELRNRDLLVKDAVRRIQVTLAALKVTGMYDRQMFEEEEQQYWNERLTEESKADLLAAGRVSKGVIQSFKQLGKKPESVFIEAEETVNKEIKQLANKGQNAVN